MKKLIASGILLLLSVTALAQKEVYPLAPGILTHAPGVLPENNGKANPPSTSTNESGRQTETSAGQARPIPQSKLSDINIQGKTRNIRKERNEE